MMTPPLQTTRALALAAGAWLVLTGAASADTKLGPATVSGEAWLGYDGESGDTRSAKYKQYRGTGAGANAGARFLVEDGGGLYLRGWAAELLSENQEYELEFGRYGSWELDFGLSQFYQEFSENSIAAHGGDRTQTLLPDIFPTGDPVDQETQILRDGSRPSLKFRQRDYRAGATWWAREDLTLDAHYRLRDRDGRRPFALDYGFAYTNIRAPIDDHSSLWDGSALLVREGWNAELGYQGSHYDNQADSITVENPTTSGSAFGRISREPDNTAHQFSLSGAKQIPGEFPMRVAGTVAYGHHKQDDSFLPYSVNPGNPALPENDLDGKVDTILANLVFTARPYRELNLKGRYRYYDYRNNTDTITFDDRSSNDGPVDSIPPPGLKAKQRNFRRQNLLLDATWRMARRTRLTVGYEWQNMYREDRNTTHQNDHVGRVTVDSRPEPWTWLRASYEYRRRNGNHYDELSSASDLRMYDQANRVSHKADLLATLMPRDDVSLTLNAGWTDANFDNKSTGLDRQTGWSVGGEASHQLNERVAVSAYYTFDRVRWTQDGSSFRGRNTNIANDLGMVLDLVLRQDVSLRLGWEYHWGKAETTATGSADYPSIKDNLQVFSAIFDQRLRDNLRLEWGYRFERFNGTNFKFDDVSVVPPDGSNNVMLRNRVDDYKAHIFLSRLILEF